MSDPSDTELIQRCLESRASASEAFDLLYARHAGPVLAFARGLHRGDEHAATDALQETFFRLHLALPAFDQARPLRPWLLRIARNVCFDALKKASARREQAADPSRVAERAGAGRGPGPLREASRREEAGILREVALALPRPELAVFLLRHDQGLTYEEAAAALGCSVRTAKYRMRAALERIGRAAEQRGVTQ